jgi:phosphoribosylanthranilate isomerase
MKPYVGITGIRTPEEAIATADCFERAGFGPGADRQGMIGVLAASRDDYRGFHATTRYPESTHMLPVIFEAVRGRVLPMLHVEIHKTPVNEMPFADDIVRILDDSQLYIRDLCMHVQLNGFPSPVETNILHEEFPGINLVFQIRKELMQQGGDEILRALDDHGTAFSHALLDPSAGMGTTFDIDRAVKIYFQLRKERPDIDVGFAGGFSPENTESRLALLRSATGNVQWSIDVEGKVRDSSDALDLHKVDAYVQAAKRGFSAH